MKPYAKETLKNSRLKPTTQRNPKEVKREAKPEETLNEVRPTKPQQDKPKETPK